MTLVALTGGIASGKTTVANRFRELGAAVIDADVVAREVVEPGTIGLQKIVAAFGQHLLNDDGTLDRKELGAIVFGNPERLQMLNAIVHPGVRKRAAELFEIAYTEEPARIIVYDVPLLAEGEIPIEWDEVVVVTAPNAIRHRRLTTLRGYSDSEAWARINSQSTEEERLSLATAVIDSSGTLEQTLEKADAVWQKFVDKYSALDSVDSE